MEFRILGPVEVSAGGTLVRLGGSKQRALLAILLINANQVVSTGRLVELLWGEDPPETSLNTLQVYVSHLRKLLEPDRPVGAPNRVLVSRSPGYLLSVDEAELDLARFERLVAEGRAALTAGQPDSAAGSLREALSIWRGPAFADVEGEAFATAEGARLAELRLRAIEDRIDADLSTGAHADLVGELRALVSTHPLRERLRGQLMLALYRSGRQAEVSSLYHETRETLAEDIGMEPGPAIERLYKAILNQDPALDWVPAEGRAPQAGSQIPGLTRALCPILVGRDQEFLLLSEALSAAPPSPGRALLLVGEAGVGKSRLASELHRLAVAGRIPVMWGGCSEAEMGIPYLPFVHALGNFLETADHSRLRQRLGPSARELSQLFPTFEGSHRKVENTDPDRARMRLFEAVVALLRVAADPNGLVLIIEDVHWADASTCELLDYVVRRLSPLRITLLVTYRDDHLRRGHMLRGQIQGWVRSSLATKIVLHPLPANAVAAMVGAILGKGSVTDELRDRLHARTEGNPFVLEEMLKNALDSGDIFRAEAGWQESSSAAIHIPSTVRDAILQRFQGLSAEQQDILRAAAILGQAFDFAALAAVSTVPESKLLLALRECVDQQLLEPSAGTNFRFRHALTQQAVYEDLLSPERVALHSLAATGLRGLPGSVPAEIAYHLLLAGRLEEAVPALIEGAEDAEKRSGYHEAADLYGRALEHVADPPFRARILGRQARAYYNAGEPAESRPRLEHAIPTLEANGLVDEAAGYRLTLGSCYWLAGHFKLARAEYESVRSTLEPRGASEALADAYNRLALLNLNDLAAGEALTMADHAISIASAAGATSARIWGYNFRGTALCELGSVEEGLQDLDRSWGEAIAVGLSDVAGDALSNAIDGRNWCFKALETGPLFDLLGTIPDVVHSGGRLATWVCYRRAMTSLLLGDIATARSAAIEGMRLGLAAESAVMLVRSMEGLLAISESAMGSARGATKILRDTASKVAELDGWDIVELGGAMMRVGLDQGEIDLALTAANQALTHLALNRPVLVPDVWMADKAVEVFIAVQRLDQAECLAERIQGSPAVMAPLVSRVEGRLALARGDAPRAIACLSAAAGLFEASGYRDDEWRTRLVLADANVLLGKTERARSELGRVIGDAEDHGHVFVAAAAVRQLDEIEAGRKAAGDA